MQTFNLKSNHRLIIILLLFTLTNCNCNQNAEALKNKASYQEKCIKLVLSENKVGHEYAFNIPNAEIDEFILTYLGAISTTDKQSIKLLNVVQYSGQYQDAKRANASIYLYDSQYNLIGLYSLGSSNSLPSHIEKNKLVFNYKNDECNQQTEIDFTDSIPSQIFVKCTSKGGDIYSFTKTSSNKQ